MRERLIPVAGVKGKSTEMASELALCNSCNQNVRKWRNKQSRQKHRDQKICGYVSGALGNYFLKSRLNWMKNVR